MSRGNPEVEWILDTQAVRFTSLPAMLHDFGPSRRRNIVVCRDPRKDDDDRDRCLSPLRERQRPGLPDRRRACRTRRRAATWARRATPL